jgi:hypothetical protein
MRSVDKGVNATPYTNYRDAASDLIGRLGWYCSYCEMEISNEPDVEHVQPKSKGGALKMWSNFLLGCKKCNKIKRAKNPSRANHLWPDEDNTFVAYEYYNEIYVRPVAALIAPYSNYAQNTLALTGIDRFPNRILNPTKKDKKDPRWQKRKIAWNVADKLLANWKKRPNQELAEAIAECAAGRGFYSIWVNKFSGEPQVLAAIKAQFPNTYEPILNGMLGYNLRPGGRF